jgi:hypothetical protein
LVYSSTEGLGTGETAGDSLLALRYTAALTELMVSSLRNTNLYALELIMMKKS